ncbi:PQQ-dependent sugar dehydrogenase [Clostridium sp. CS001]|uniref:PQQ-dependent sugar dehydrogenase n=1 Tax=Clostridium sp. CS001 TaxID=2880648 RepID=UPI001CF33CB4|nr:PQQ-dependent sugar dehydrogenase [Clostridium sp. CS001]MCB2288525.1 PQQ-dependent sugar dehydrogenase [Clostridium sp. CS001]
MIKEEQQSIPHITTSSGEASVSESSSEHKEKYERKLNPSDIKLPLGYEIDVFAQDLDTPISMVFTDKGEMLVADAGVISGSGKVLRHTSDGFKIVAEGFNPPVTGINYLNGNIYVSHRGYITIVKPDGTKQDIISGLPSLGDHHNNQVVFGPDGKMYFGQGTATNSGVVGLDNSWVKKHPFFHDYPGSNLILNGENFVTENIQTASPNDYTYTGAYSPFGVPSMPCEVEKGITRASGSILRANIDGSNLELLAFGLRNPFRLKFDRFNRLFSTNHGADVRGSRPIDNSPDEFQLIMPGVWYGWPDYTGGLPVILPIFKAEGKAQPRFLIANHPMLPPKPFALFTAHAAIMGFDFNYNNEFGPYGDAYIAEYGSEAPETTGGKPLPGVGHRISKINMSTGQISTFAINKSGFAASYTGAGGFERPIDVVFGPDKAMYILDFAVTPEDEPDEFQPKTGVIWKIQKTGVPI